MKKVGIWIDHRKAVVVIIENGEENLLTITGDIDRHPEATGGWRTSTPWGPQSPNQEHHQEGHFQHQLANFYKEVIKAIGKPDQLFVMGPAQAKHEFAEAVEKVADLRAVPLKLEAADKMTDPQVAAKVRATEF